MAGLGDLLQRIARSLEEASAQRPGDDLRARLGYGAGDDDEDEPASGAVREPEAAPEPGSARTSKTVREPETAWSPKASRTPAHGTATPRASAVLRASRAGRDIGSRPSSPGAPPRLDTSSASPLSERVRARLHTPDALREAFVVKEILDRPLGRRRRAGDGAGLQPSSAVRMR